MKATKKENKTYSEFPREIESLRNHQFPGIVNRGVHPLQSLNYGFGIQALNPYYQGLPQYAGWPAGASYNPQFGPYQQVAPYVAAQPQSAFTGYPAFQQNHQHGQNPAFLGDQETSAPVNISEDEESYIIELTVPGYKKQDCKVKVKDNVLYVFGRRELEKEAVFYSLKEYRNTFFERTFLLSSEVETSDIEANCVDGILTLVLPKKSEESLVEKEIEVTEEELV